MCGRVWQALLSLAFFYNHGRSITTSIQNCRANPGWTGCARIRMKTANQLINLEASSWCGTPTKFQRSSSPKAWRDRISVIHDGIDTDSSLSPRLLRRSPLRMSCFKPGEKIVTFVNRNLEPYRATNMIRAIPKLQQLVPDAKLLIDG